MKTIPEMRDELSHNIRAAKDVTDRAEGENRQVTKEEAGLIDQYMAKAETLKDEIKIAEANDARAAKVAAAYEGLKAAQPRQTEPAQITSQPADDRRADVKVIARFGKLQAFKGRDADYNAFKAGQSIRAHLGNWHAQRWCENNGVDYRNAMSEGTNTGGGFLVPTEMAQAIIDLREDYGVFRRNTRVIPMASDTLQIPRVAGNVTAYWTGEASAPTASDMTLGQVNLVAKKLACLTYVSTELAEDAVASIADLLAKDMAWKFAVAEDQAGFIGDGTSTYGGIQGFTSKLLGKAGAVDAATNHDTFAEIDASDLAAAMAKLPAYARMNAKWYCSQVAYDLVFGRIAATAGGNTVQTLNGAFAPSYLGYPIVVSQVLPTSTGDLSDVVMLLFGDLALASTMGERRGISVRRSDEVKFVEDQIALKATERIDIAVHDVGDASTAGPVVALIGE